MIPEICFGFVKKREKYIVVFKESLANEFPESSFSENSVVECFFDLFDGHHFVGEFVLGRHDQPVSALADCSFHGKQISESFSVY